MIASANQATAITQGNYYLVVVPQYITEGKYREVSVNTVHSQEHHIRIAEDEFRVIKDSRIQENPELVQRITVLVSTTTCWLRLHLAPGAGRRSTTGSDHHLPR